MKQLKIIKYLKGNKNCISYDADIEMNIDTENICPPTKKIKLSNLKNNKNNVNKIVDMDVLSFMLNNLSTKNKPRYNLRSKTKIKNIDSKTETRKRKANTKSMKKEKPSKKKKIDIEDLLADLEI